MFTKEIDLWGYMFDKVNILGVKISDLTIDEIVELIIESAKKKTGRVLFTPNSEIIESFRKDKELLSILNSADILAADGIGVVLAAKILKKPLRGRAAGYDIAVKLLENAGELSFYFFGGAPGIAENAKDNLEIKYPEIKIVGTKDGYNYDDSLPDEIAEKKADIVFVCLGAEKQERWIYENRERLSDKILMGVGGSIDVFSGRVKRAPNFFIKLHLEWLYRLIKQPSRFIRMLALPKFLIAVVLKRLKNARGREKVSRIQR